MRYLSCLLPRLAHLWILSTLMLLAHSNKLAHTETTRDESAVTTGRRTHRRKLLYAGGTQVSPQYGTGGRAVGRVLAPGDSAFEDGFPNALSRCGLPLVTNALGDWAGIPALGRA